jgi:5'-3' exonuclease
MQCGIDIRSRIYDYIFLCFFLGNDFLPHFPSLNIRTHGIEVLLEIYRIYIGKYADRSFVTETNSQLKIQWKWVNVYIKELSKREHDYLIQEYDLRSKWNKRMWSIETDKDVELLKQSAPVIYRAEEDYIFPSEKGWEQRYYKSLFSKHSTVKDVCKNYIEGLQWVFMYYTSKCPDWRWKYNYCYPPLLTDLQSYISSGISDYFTEDNLKYNPFSQMVQLSYVLPFSNHGLLNVKVRDYLHKNDRNLYPNDIHYKWAFCRYLWEAHVELPEIPLDKLVSWEKTFSKLKT